MNIERRRFREGIETDPLLLIPFTALASFVTLMLIFIILRISDTPISPDPPEFIKWNLWVFLYSTWGSCVYLASINIDLNDFRKFLKEIEGIREGDLI